jgi:hypothetical protein
MPLTSDQKEKLRVDLIGIETKEIIAELTWPELKAEIVALSDADGEAITLAITGRGESATPMIERKLLQFASAGATQKVDAYLSTMNDAQIEYLARLLW